MIYGFEKYVGCEPYKDRSIETKNIGGATGTRGFNYMVSKNLLVPLKVMYANPEHNIQRGDFVFIKHEDIAGNVGWAKDIDVEVPGSNEKVTIMVVPLDKIMLVQSAR